MALWLALALFSRAEAALLASLEGPNVITIQPAVIPLLNQLDERMADLRTRAQETTSAENAAELTRLAERLAERKAQIMQRRQEVR